MLWCVWDGGWAEDDGVAFQAEEKYVPRFLDLRAMLVQQPRAWSRRNWEGEHRLRIPLCGPHCLEIPIGSLMVVSFPAPLETNSSCTHRHPHPSLV